MTEPKSLKKMLSKAYIQTKLFWMTSICPHRQPPPSFSICSVFNVSDFYELHHLSPVILLHLVQLTEKHYKQEIRMQEEYAACVYSVQDHNQQSHLFSNKGSFCTQRCNWVLLGSPPLSHCCYCCDNSPTLVQFPQLSLKFYQMCLSFLLDLSMGLRDSIT